MAQQHYLLLSACWTVRLSATACHAIDTRVYPLSQENRRRDSGRSQPAFDRGQLWNSQTSKSDGLAQAAFTVPFALQPDFKFLVEHGRAVVSRDHRQTHSSWYISEYAIIDRGPLMPVTMLQCYRLATRMGGYCLTTAWMPEITGSVIDRR